MVATLLRLRLTQLRHTLATDTWRLVLLLLGVLWALAMVPSVLTGMTWLSTQPVDVVRDVLVVGGSLLVLGWLVVPVMVPGLDDSLDVRRFATHAVPPARLVPGLLVASLLGVPTAFAGLLCLAPVIAWGGAGRGWALLTAALLVPVLLATCVLGARLSTTLAARALGARRAREAGAAAAVVALLVVTGVVVGAGRLGLEGVLEGVPGAAAVLGWTPLGAGWAAPALVADGDLLGAAARVAVALGGVAVAVLVWTRLLHLQLVAPPARSGHVRRRADAILPTREPMPLTRRDGHGAVAARAVMRRALRYWTADPRYAGAVLSAVVLPVLIVLLVAAVVDAPAAVALSVAPLVAGSIGWGRHNDVAYDGSAFWLHVVSRVPGWADRAGRAAATLVWALPVVVAVGLGGAAVAGRPDLTAASVGVGVGVLGAGLAVSAVSSAVLAYPVPAPGANPYATEPGAVGAGLVAQLVTGLLTLALCTPVLVAYAAALWWRADLAWATLAVGLLTAAAALAGGCHLGGRAYDARSVRLLARL